MWSFLDIAAPILILVDKVVNLLSMLFIPRCKDGKYSVCLNLPINYVVVFRLYTKQLLWLVVSIEFIEQLECTTLEENGDAYVFYLSSITIATATDTVTGNYQLIFSYFGSPSTLFIIYCLFQHTIFWCLNFNSIDRCTHDWSVNRKIIFQN